VLIAIFKKCTLFRPKLKFMAIVGAKIRQTCTSKDSKREIVWFGLKHALNGCLKVDNLAMSTVDKIDSGSEVLILEFQRHRSLGKKSEAYFHYMAMFSFR
jgi:hypothetical protein